MTNRAERRAAARSGSTVEHRYGKRRGGRIAAIPAVLCAAVLLAGIGVSGGDAEVVIKYVVAILAAIVAVFAAQGRAWWWMAPLGAIVVVWNPVVPFDLTGQLWALAQVAAAAVLVAAGLTIRRPDH